MLLRHYHADPDSDRGFDPDPRYDCERSSPLSDFSSDPGTASDCERRATSLLGPHLLLQLPRVPVAAAFREADVAQRHRPDLDQVVPQDLREGVSFQERWCDGTDARVASEPLLGKKACVCAQDHGVVQSLLPHQPRDLHCADTAFCVSH